MNRKLVCLTPVAVFLLEIGVGMRGLAQGSGDMKRIRCAKRVAILEPPRIELPKRGAFEGQEQEILPARHLKPVCPEDEVPVTAFPTTKHFIKGKPNDR